MTTPAPEFENAPDFKSEPLKAHARRGSHVRRNRIPIFLAVVLTILFTANWFVWATWNHFWTGPGNVAWGLILPALTLTFIASMFLGWRFSGLWLRLMYRISAIGLGFLNFAFFASAAAWIVALVGLLLGLHIEPKIIATVFAGAVMLAGLYGLVNGSWLRVTRVTVKLPNLPAAWIGRSVALVTDMHLGNVRGAGFTRRIVTRLQALNPDAVFISGDMFDGVTADFDALVEPWKALSTRAGIFFVCGNHEEFDDREKFVDAVMRSGIKVLNGEKVDLDGLQIVGIHDEETNDPSVFKARLQHADVDRSRASILLAHRPSNLAIPAGEGILLQLSGHTHGGQIWPWHWLARRVHGKYVHGLHHFERMQVLTSYGAGTWGIPMRVWTKSEIVLIQLEADTD